jgi:hypothetical protein
MAKETAKEMREKIVKQALSEIAFARKYKEGKIAGWHKNENLYYAKKPITANEARANVELGRMQEFVHTILSKIDSPLTFTYTKRKDAQLRRVARLNALRRTDATNGFWDLKDMLGKKQAVIYGRAIYFYYADSKNGRYQSHLDNCDVYDFLIDPKAGGLDVEKARYLGRYGIVFDRYDLEDAPKGVYDKEELKALLDDTASNSNEINREERNKLNRQYGTDGKTQKQIKDDDKFVFWEWFTTYKGKRYYMLLSEKGARAIRIEKLTDMFTPTEDFPKGAWPVWTWAAFPDLTEFWSPSYCDYVREIFMAQSTTINQAIDNTEQVNKPQKVVNIALIEDEASLKYRKDGVIKTKSNADASKVVQLLQVPSIDTPIKLFQLLETIQEKASGVTAAAKGVADVDGRATIYAGNMENVADRFGLLNKSYSFGYRRFAQLYEIGVKDHLTKRVALDILGTEGVEVENVARSDIYRKGDTFGLLIESSKAEDALSIQERKDKNAYLTELMTLKAPVNIQKVIETKGKLVGFDEQEIRQLLDVNNFASMEVLAEAERDIEQILDGKKVKPNPIANIAYKQKFLDYMQDHEEDMTHEQFMSLSEHLLGVEQIVNANLARSINQVIREKMMTGGLAPDPALPNGATGMQDNGTPATPAPAQVPSIM